MCAVLAGVALFYTLPVAAVQALLQVGEAHVCVWTGFFLEFASWVPLKTKGL